MSFFGKLFKEAGVKDVITLFHAPKNPSSIRVYTLLKQTISTGQATATQDQASSHEQQPKTDRTEIDFQVEENAPTADQLQSILEYAGDQKAGSVISGSTSISDAVKKARQGSQISRPLVVDWNKGAIVIGDNESEILKLVKASSQK